MVRYARSNVLGLVAIFIALGGVAWAVQIAPKNSVVSKSIKNGQVKTGDIANKAVKSPNLAPSAADDFVPADDIGMLNMTATCQGAVATGDCDQDVLSVAGITVNVKCTDTGPQNEMHVTVEGDVDAINLIHFENNFAAGVGGNPEILGKSPGNDFISDGFQMVALRRTGSPADELTFTYHWHIDTNGPSTTCSIDGTYVHAVDTT